jgi:acetyl esterase/lipase
MLGAAPTSAHADAWRPPSGTIEIPLWPPKAHLVQPDVSGPEAVEISKSPKAALPVTWVWNVTRPTLTIFASKGVNSGAAMLVFPGGGYKGLAIDLEGTEVCDWAIAHGITCAVLKYRVPWGGPHWDELCKCQKPPAVPMALQDAQRAVATLRHEARQSDIDPHKIGVIGFSAGGHLVQDVTNADELAYAPLDRTDDQDTRPDFGIALYPGHLWAGSGTELEQFDHISAKAPPTFIAAAEDDPVDDVRNSLTYFVALKAVGVPVEMHIYAHGGHGFGLRQSGQPITGWPELVLRWLRTIGILRSRV